MHYVFSIYSSLGLYSQETFQQACFKSKSCHSFPCTHPFWVDDINEKLTVSSFSQICWPLQQAVNCILTLCNLHLLLQHLFVSSQQQSESMCYHPNEHYFQKGYEKKKKSEFYCIQLWKDFCNLYTIYTNTILWWGKDMPRCYRVMPHLPKIVFLCIYWSSFTLLKNFLHTTDSYIWLVISLSAYDSFWNTQSVASSFINEQEKSEKEILQ